MARASLNPSGGSSDVCRLSRRWPVPRYFGTSPDLKECGTPVGWHGTHNVVTFRIAEDLLQGSEEAVCLCQWLVRVAEGRASVADAP
jgi:hypothetical protein